MRSDPRGDHETGLEELRRFALCVVKMHGKAVAATLRKLHRTPRTATGVPLPVVLHPQDRQRFPRNEPRHCAQGDVRKDEPDTHPGIPSVPFPHCGGTTTLVGVLTPSRITRAARAR